MTALLADGDHLLVGAGTRLFQMTVTSDGLQVARSIDLGRTTIRALGASGSVHLALTEDGLTSLDSLLKPVAFLPGGGQRLAISGNQVYIAALKAGVRVVQVSANGQLTRLGAFDTAGPAFDLSLDPANHLWVAEGNAGLMLYDTANLNAPAVLTTLPAYTPALVVRSSGPRLIIGHGENVSILDSSTGSLRPLTTLPLVDIRTPTPDPAATASATQDAALTGTSSGVSDIIELGSRLYVGRSAGDGSGPDVVILNVAGDGAVKIMARIGERGSGERLALLGDDVFIGAEQDGIQRARLYRGAFTVVQPWSVSATTQAPCAAVAPTDPVPPNLASVNDNPLRLEWRSACADSFEVHINGKLVATLKAVDSAATPSADSADSSGKLRYQYTFSPPQGQIEWQITALNSSGTHADGPTWRLEALPGGWAATPQPVPSQSLIYRPPLLDLHSPSGIVLVLGGGVLVIVIGSWWIGNWAERRAVRVRRASEAEDESTDKPTGPGQSPRRPNRQ